jgi:glycosyltransferase involved in cell wall biosynthesis
MRIGIDIRSLGEAHPGGVAAYTRGIVSSLLRLDTVNEYVLFSNAWNKSAAWTGGEPNVKLVASRWPNKIFHATQCFLGQPKLDRLCGGLDLFFMPNWNFASLTGECPLVLTVHDLSHAIYPGLLSQKRRWWHWFIGVRRLLKRANHIIAVSECTRRDLVELFQISEDKITVVPSGLTLPSVMPDETAVAAVLSRLKLNQPYFLALNFLEPRKNTIALLEAYHRYRSNGSGTSQLVIVGQPSWQDQHLRQLAQELEIESAVRFVGYAPEADKYALLRGALAFIYPSVYEGFGFPPLESLACGTPVIMAHAASLPEVLGSRALLVDPYNVAELAEALGSIEHQPALRERLTKGADELIRQFRWSNTAQNTLDIFNRIKLHHENRH